MLVLANTETGKSETFTSYDKLYSYLRNELKIEDKMTDEVVKQKVNKNVKSLVNQIQGFFQTILEEYIPEDEQTESNFNIDEVVRPVSSKPEETKEEWSNRHKCEWKKIEEMKEEIKNGIQTKDIFEKNPYLIDKSKVQKQEMNPIGAIDVLSLKLELDGIVSKPKTKDEELTEKEQKIKKEIEFVYLAYIQGKKPFVNEKGELVIDETIPTITLTQEERDKIDYCFGKKTKTNNSNDGVPDKKNVLCSNEYENDYGTVDVETQNTNPVQDQYDRSPFNQIAGIVNGSKIKMADEVAEQYFIQQGEEDVTESGSTLTTTKDESLSSDYYKYKTPENDKTNKRQLQDDAKVVLKWFIEKCTVPYDGANAPLKCSTNPFEHYEDVRNCWKLFLLNPTFCDPLFYAYNKDGYDSEEHPFDQIQYPKSLLSLLPEGTFSVHNRDRALLEKLTLELPTDRKMVYEIYFKGYKNIMDKITSLNLVNEMRPFVYQTLAGCFIDKKVHASVMRNWVSFFCQTKLGCKDGSMIPSSEMYAKWIDFLKNIFGEQADIWSIVQASTNTRQFSRDMKHNGFFTRRRSVGILYENVSFEVTCANNEVQGVCSVNDMNIVGGHCPYASVI